MYHAVKQISTGVLHCPTLLYSDTATYLRCSVKIQLIYQNSTYIVDCIVLGHTRITYHNSIRPTLITTHKQAYTSHS